MTVSRVLSDENHKVSEDTRVRVLKAVRELEYVPVAQPMTQSRNIATRVIGLHFMGSEFEGQWGQPTFLGFREAAKRLNYDLLVHTRTLPEWMADQEEMQFLDRRSDGLIFITPVGQYQILEMLAERKLPVVACYLDDVPSEIPVVVVDNQNAMRQVVECLHAKGHERILYLTADQQRSDFAARQKGYELAMIEKKLNPLSMQIDMSEWPYTQAGEALFKKIQEHKITAIACHNDHCATFAWDVAEENGLKVPQDLSITGMDDLPISAQRGLTSVYFSCEDVGRRALEIVVDLIQGKKCESPKFVVPVELVERSSVAPPP